MKRTLFAGLLLMSSFAVTMAQVKLSFNPEKGKKYEFHIETIENSKESAMRQEQSKESETVIKFLMEIKEKTPLETRVLFTYREIVYIFSYSKIKMEYDSKSPIENPSEIDKLLEKLLGKLLDKSFIAVIAPDGSVTAIEMDAINEIMAQSVTVDDPMSEPMSVAIKQEFSESSIKRMIEQSLKFYPANAVKVRESWTMEDTYVSNLNLTTKTQYTLNKIKKNIASITVVALVDVTHHRMEGKLTGTKTGTMLVDTKTGMPVSSNLLQNVAGAFKVRNAEVSTEIITNKKTSIKEVR